MAPEGFVVTIADAMPVRELIEKALAVIEARAAGADMEEARSEVDALECAVARLGGYYEKVCGQCGVPFQPNHRHVLSVTWVAPGDYLRSHGMASPGAV